MHIMLFYLCAIFFALMLSHLFTFTHTRYLAQQCTNNGLFMKFYGILLLDILLFYQIIVLLCLVVLYFNFLTDVKQ